MAQVEETKSSFQELPPEQDETTLQVAVVDLVDMIDEKRSARNLSPTTVLVTNQSEESQVNASTQVSTSENEKSQQEGTEAIEDKGILEDKVDVVTFIDKDKKQSQVRPQEEEKEYVRIESEKKIDTEEKNMAYEKDSIVDETPKDTEATDKQEGIENTKNELEEKDDPPLDESMTDEQGLEIVFAEMIPVQSPKNYDEDDDSDESETSEDEEVETRRSPRTELALKEAFQQFDFDDEEEKDITETSTELEAEVKERETRVATEVVTSEAVSEVANIEDSSQPDDIKTQESSVTEEVVTTAAVSEKAVIGEDKQVDQQFSVAEEVVTTEAVSEEAIIEEYMKPVIADAETQESRVTEEVVITTAAVVEEDKETVTKKVLAVEEDKEHATEEVVTTEDIVIKEELEPVIVYTEIQECIVTKEIITTVDVSDETQEDVLKTEVVPEDADALEGRANDENEPSLETGRNDALTCTSNELLSPEHTFLAVLDDGSQVDCANVDEVGNEESVTDEAVPANLIDTEVVEDSATEEVEAGAQKENNKEEVNKERNPYHEATDEVYLSTLDRIDDERIENVSNKTSFSVRIEEAIVEDEKIENADSDNGVVVKIKDPLTGAIVTKDTTSVKQILKDMKRKQVVTGKTNCLAVKTNSTGKEQLSGLTKCDILSPRSDLRLAKAEEEEAIRAMEKARTEVSLQLFQSPYCVVSSIIILYTISHSRTSLITTGNQSKGCS